MSVILKGMLDVRGNALDCFQKHFHLKSNAQRLFMVFEESAFCDLSKIWHFTANLCVWKEKPSIQGGYNEGNLEFSNAVNSQEKFISSLN